MLPCPWSCNYFHWPQCHRHQIIISSGSLHMWNLIIFTLMQYYMHANICICTKFINIPTIAYAYDLSNLLHSLYSYANFLCVWDLQNMHISKEELKSLPLNWTVLFLLNLTSVWIDQKSSSNYSCLNLPTLIPSSLMTTFTGSRFI